ncbi:6-phosphofructokinase [Saprospiraceae bacterium]|nr:6-phosphofructokinase [Saprospiraceae bacterium]
MNRIAILSSGGDAPGMNAAIRAVVRTAIYNNIKVYGINRGYEGLINGDVKQLSKADVANIIHKGGTILKTARSKSFRTEQGRKEAFEFMEAFEIDGLVVIGGNGTYTGAMKLSEEHNIKVIGLPGTIDNDIYGTDYTIGFDTAINTAVEAVDKIRDTADSHSRLFFIEVMGRHSGYIALYTGIGSGSSYIFLPEEECSLEKFTDLLKKSNRRNKLFNLVIVAEGNTHGGAQELSKIVNEELGNNIDIKNAVIGHLQRGGSPTAADRILASKLGYHGVNALIQGQSNVAIGIVDKKVVYTPFADAINKKKLPDENMITMAEILAL